jgi:hypothetical protein
MIDTFFYFYFFEIESVLVKVLLYSKNNGKIVMLEPKQCLANLLMVILGYSAENGVEVVRWRNN